ncbi:hypothetical protein Y1Q_0016846 [Alligator mississippiensis]|uniref:Uncharacterized protein n=1 Tax=Alligator mississippiensis TaxID=8496 RepID=A0A151P6U4_ALLMI|nr:hypothetical protein Y1Q_0016846 [Alligator mississippiensis]
MRGCWRWWQCSTGTRGPWGNAGLPAEPHPGPQGGQETEAGGGVDVEEINTLLCSFQNGKTAKTDSLPKEFCLAFWDQVGLDLLEVYRQHLQQGHLYALWKARNLLINRHADPTVEDCTKMGLSEMYWWYHTKTEKDNGEETVDLIWKRGDWHRLLRGKYSEENNSEDSSDADEYDDNE